MGGQATLGQRTTAPSPSSLAGRRACASPDFAPPPDLHAGCNDSSDRRTTSRCWADWLHTYVHTAGRLCWCSGHPPWQTLPQSRVMVGFGDHAFPRMESTLSLSCQEKCCIEYPEVPDRSGLKPSKASFLPAMD